MICSGAWGELLSIKSDRLQGLSLQQKQGRLTADTNSVEVFKPAHQLPLHNLHGSRGHICRGF